MLKLKTLNWLLLLLQVYASKTRSEYKPFVDEMNDALVRLSPTESAVVMEDFNAHIGTDTWKSAIRNVAITSLGLEAWFCSTSL